MTFGVAIFSLLAQGLTIGGLLRRLGLRTGDASEQLYEKLLGRIALNLTAADHMNELAREKAILPDLGRRLASEYTERAMTAEAEMELIRIEGREAFKRLEREARLKGLNAGKSSLMDLYQRGSLSKEVYAELVREANKEIDDLKRG